MSRIGKNPIVLPEGVMAEYNDLLLKVTGPKGSLTQKIHQDILVEIRDGRIILSPKKQNKLNKALWGTFRSILQNMVTGTTEGYEKKLEVNGVGYKINLSANKLVLNIGYSHPVEFVLPEGIQAQVENNVITVMGIDKQLVGETAAQIRKIRKPEPYKGKGIKYVEEVIRKKAGKAAKAVGGN